MKPINLYDIYRKVSHRRRSIKSIETQRRAEAMRDAADAIIDRPTLKLVKEFRKAEDLWLDSDDVLSNMNFADQFEDAIRSKNFVSERSFYDPRGINGTRQTGVVYCAMSASRPGQLKIGFTTLKLKVRFQKMSKRQNIVEPYPLFAISVSYPAMIEAHAKSNLREYLVSGCTQGQSVEWYETSAIRIARTFVSSIVAHGSSVDKVMLFPDCKNASNIKFTLSRLGVEVSKESWR